MVLKQTALTCAGILSTLLLSSCSMDAAITDLSQSIKEVVYNFKTSNKEMVAASQQGTVTAQNYKVQSSLSYQGGSSEVITSKNYKVKTNVQATLYKE